MAAGTGSRLERSADGLSVSVPGAGSCFFTSLPSGDFTDPSAEQLEVLAGAAGAAGRCFSRSEQVHGSSVRLVKDAAQAAEAGEYDGQVTTSRQVVCAVRTADCLPVALLSADAAGVVHAGWRGLAAGVVAEGVKAMRSVGPSPITAVIGPGAGACCYQAGPEVHEAFSEMGPKARRGENADLAWIASEQLSKLGVTDIIDAGTCTICATAPAWHSYRRDGEDAGRSLALAWRN